MSLSNSFNSAAQADTVLINAVKNGSIEMVKKLIELGADINIPSPPSTGALNVPIPGMPMPPATTPAAPVATAPEKRKKPVVTKMATERQVTAPATARFKKSPQKRQTTL